MTKEFKHIPEKKEEYVHSKYEYEIDKIIRFHPRASSSEELTRLKRNG
jgi:hypothetical protein